MQAIWREGEVHGTTGAFVDHGVAMLLSRLSELDNLFPQRRRERSLSGRQLREVEAFIQLRLADDLTVADMAALAGRDVASFSRAFREATGLTPYQFLPARRMELAEKLLSDGASVTHTALAVGYCNLSKFAATFRRVIGRLPSDQLKS